MDALDPIIMESYPRSMGFKIACPANGLLVCPVKRHHKVTANWSLAHLIVCYQAVRFLW